MSKVVLVIPTMHQGGAERVMSELANAWSAQQHEIHLVLLAKSKSFYCINDNVIMHNLEFSHSQLLSKIYNELKVFFKLRRILKEQNPDFVLSFMSKYNILTILATSNLNLKVFVSDRSNPKKQLPFLISFLRKITYRFAHGIIAQTSLAKSVLEENTGNRNIVVIPNPLKAISVCENIEKDKIILNVGRLVEEKGQKYLLEAFTKIKNTEWKIAILGDGPLYDRLKKQAEELGLKDQVIMPGAVSEIDHWLARASIFAFPSVSEGFPNALVEAMAAGLPCVSFDCDAGPRDIIIDGKNGYLVPVRDVEVLASRLETLINNAAIRTQLSKEAAKIVNDFGVEKISDDYLTFCMGQ
ncbi:glycosyltransferase family 4 protein [Methylobacter sp. YRD-M1]|uniref:glycosyltransferase family 4 protein n=1 Tax=Methylobacter sp. YRD-M1 TaxID=2911520 RepID=UPI00227BCC54|nr:glycosyltransferase family 4 protein [Methylobacter sp. YRD-M1]WAK01562.1 glycosyltransferase family 4 protein [Methylobacter sp. YRD-M1]